MPDTLIVAIAASVTLFINLVIWLFCFFTLLSLLGLLSFTLIDKGLVTFLFFPGLCQLIYVIPIWLVLALKRRFTIIKGSALGAALTALLNGSYWIFLNAS
ncbi:MAG: hypothetical protein AAF921_23925 [Cyanobacteria bacterium P01_D01_bin.44]